MTPLQHHDKRTAKGMGIHAELMLDLLREMLVDGLPCEVMECNNLAVYREIGSPATLHKSMKWLLENKYIALTTSERDARAKTCALTRKGIDYLADDQTKAT
jgi:hypothetical protein